MALSLFDHSFMDPFRVMNQVALPSKHLRINLQEYEDRFEVSADVPGFAKDQVTVDFDERHNVLTISANKAEEKKTDTEEDGVVVHRMERSSAAMTRAVRLPHADPEAIAASTVDGVLTVRVGKLPPDAPARKIRRIAVE